MPANLGEFEQLVLLALLRLGGKGYGITVQEELGRQAGRNVSLGTVYKTLFRMESKGLVTVHLGEPTPERGGRRKKHYAVTLAGRKALQRSLSALRKLSRGVDAVWELP
jgi:DNA-binding PadR family transcriptional regulator